MKKTVMMAAALAVLSAGPVWAEHGGGEHHGGGKDNMPRKLEDADTNADGLVSKDEFIASHIRRFEEMDTNKDGNIDKAEIDARREAWREKMKEKRAQKEEGAGTAPESPAGE